MDAQSLAPRATINPSHTKNEERRRKGAINKSPNTTLKERKPKTRELSMPEKVERST